MLFTSGPAFGEAIGILEEEPLYHTSLDPDEYCLLLDRNGFDVVTHVAETLTAAGARSGWRVSGSREGVAPFRNFPTKSLAVIFQGKICRKNQVRRRGTDSRPLRT